MEIDDSNWLYTQQPIIVFTRPTGNFQIQSGGSCRSWDVGTWWEPRRNGEIRCKTHLRIWGSHVSLGFPSTQLHKGIKLKSRTAQQKTRKGLCSPRSPPCRLLAVRTVWNLGTGRTAVDMTDVWVQATKTVDYFHQQKASWFHWQQRPANKNAGFELYIVPRKYHRKMVDFSPKYSNCIQLHH